MTQDYDKIIKENLEAIFIPLSRKILKIESEIFEELPDSLQKTLEREPDFLKLVKHENASKNFILQIEFQSNYDHEMSARMLEYYGLIHRKYKLPLVQHVFYMGAKKKKIKNVLRHESIEFR
jgi:hypothetical protein